KDEIADANRLVGRRALEGRGRGLGTDDGLVHGSPQSRITVMASASATPSALNIASTTCALSSPSTSRTWMVNPAASASAERKRLARAGSSPPTRGGAGATFAAARGG